MESFDSVHWLIFHRSFVEHCHVDHPYDVVNLQSDDRLREFGERDARAVARYFGLTSIDNKTSYKDYAPLAVPTPHGKSLPGFYIT